MKEKAKHINNLFNISHCFSFLISLQLFFLIGSISPSFAKNELQLNGATLLLNFKYSQVWSVYDIKYGSIENNPIIFLNQDLSINENMSLGSKESIGIDKVPFTYWFECENQSSIGNGFGIGGFFPSFFKLFAPIHYAVVTPYTHVNSCTSYFEIRLLTFTNAVSGAIFQWAYLSIGFGDTGFGEIPVFTRISDTANPDTAFVKCCNILKDCSTSI
jgi:hypothetical protein